MKIKLIKCGVCDSWHSPWNNVRGIMHCSHCGAHHRSNVFIAPADGPAMKKTYHLNSRGIEMVRGVPPSVHSAIERLIKHLGE